MAAVTSGPMPSPAISTTGVANVPPSPRVLPARVRGRRPFVKRQPSCSQTPVWERTSPKLGFGPAQRGNGVSQTGVPKRRLGTRGWQGCEGGSRLSRRRGESLPAAQGGPTVRRAPGVRPGRAAFSGGVASGGLWAGRYNGAIGRNYLRAVARAGRVAASRRGRPGRTHAGG